MLKKLLIASILPLCFYAQEQENDSIAEAEKVKKRPAVTFKDYKIISLERDTTYIDSSLTIQKAFRNNYIRRDDFELMPFANMGQPYNHLGYDFSKQGLYPHMGARASHVDYEELRDIKFYRVASPTTELFYKTGMEQGQMLDALLTVNTTPELNLTIGYKGLHSLGKYRNALANIDKFTFSANYASKNGRYTFRTHVLIHNNSNQQYGGIKNPSEFESGEANFDLRSRITVFFDNATSELISKRYFIENEYTLVQGIGKNGLKIGHRLNYDIRNYIYSQNANNEFFGNAYKTSKLVDSPLLKVLENKVYLSTQLPLIGNLRFGVQSYNVDYVLKGEIIQSTGKIDRQITSNEVALQASWKAKINRFLISADAASNIIGKLGGQYIEGNISYPHNEDFSIKAFAAVRSYMPNYNMLLYQSDYTNYNYENLSKFKRQNSTQIGLALGYKKFLSLSADYNLLSNYTFFFNSDDPMQPSVLPLQYDKIIGYGKIKAEAEFHLWKFSLHNTLMYQNVLQESAVLNIPSFVTRNALFFSSNVFDKAMFLQTGLIFKMFTPYYADGYNPLISEFFTQNQHLVGGFPLIDAFVNARVKQTRIYLQLDHINSAFTAKNYYSAPYYPYRDWIFRLGIVWNFFM